MCNPNAKAGLRRRLNRLMFQYIVLGGSITRCPAPRVRGGKTYNIVL